MARVATRAIAGHPQDTQIMYGVAGERMLTELELPWLNGYEKSAPVRIGNAAHQQFQLDVYGEVIDTCTSRVSTSSNATTMPGGFRAR